MNSKEYIEAGKRNLNNAMCMFDKVKMNEIGDEEAGTLYLAMLSLVEALSIFSGGKIVPKVVEPKKLVFVKKQKEKIFKEPKPKVPYTGRRASELPKLINEREFQEYLRDKKEEQPNSKFWLDEADVRDWLSKKGISIL